MSKNSPAETASIEFQFDEEYQQNVRAGNPDRWINVAVTVGDTDIWDGVRGSACGIVLGLLASVETVSSGERYIIEFEWGPDWMVIEPAGEDIVTVSRASTFAGAQNPDKRLDIDSSRQIIKSEWTNAVVTAAEEFCETVFDINPDLGDQDVMMEIDRKVNDVK